MMREMIRLQIIVFTIVVIIPKVFSIPLPQQSSPSNFPTNETGSESRNHILYWIFGIIGIAVFVEIIYWMFRFVNLLRREFRRDNNNIQSINGIINFQVNRRRGLFDTPSYAGSIDEELPPYEGFSLPKYNVNEVNENISNEGGESINSQMAELNPITNSNYTNTNNTNAITNPITNPDTIINQSIEPLSPSLPQPPLPAHVISERPPSYRLV